MTYCQWELVIWIVGIVFSILIAFSFFNAVAGFSVVGFWLLWTLGFSSVFVGYALTGPLAIIQFLIILLAVSFVLLNFLNLKILNFIKLC